MIKSPDILGATGLKFFGEISASISHELKNVLSIINESAGLLDDLTLMVPKGVPMDPVKIQTTARRMQQQVLRADRIIKNMNRFSHSIDRDQDTLDVCDLLESLLILTQRLSDMKGVTVEVESSDTPVMMTTSSFFLIILVWHIISIAFEMLGERKTMTLSVSKSEGNVEIRIAQLENLQTDRTDGFLSETDTTLLKSLGGTVSLIDDSMLLTLPQGNLC